MAFETKAILSLLARQIAGSKSLKEAYGAVESAANAEGAKIDSFEDMKKKIEEERNSD